MSSVIQNIMQKTLGDGARATKFDVLFEFTNPKSALPPQDAMALVKATTFPGVTHTTMDFKYKGRSVPIRGQVKYTQTWDCTFYLTQDHSLKYAFDNWIVALDEVHGYAMRGQGGAFLNETRKQHAQRGYTTTIKLYQKDFEDTTETAEYTLFNVYPTEVTPIQYSYDSTGQIQEFTVTFAYSYFTMGIHKGGAGNFIDTLIGKFKDASKALVDGVIGGLSNSINSFVKDATGDTLNKLNDWAKGLSTDILPSMSDKSFGDMVEGGTGPTGMATGIYNEVVQQAGAVGNYLSSKLSAVQGQVSGAVNSGLSQATTKVKSLF